MGRQSLLARADAVAALFRAHHRRLVGLATLLCDDRATAEDVVQEAFAGLYRRWWQLRDPQSAVAYLNKAVVNGGRDHLRRGQRSDASMLRMVPQSEALSSAEQDVVANDEADRMWRAIAPAAAPSAAGARPALLPRPERGRDRGDTRCLARLGEAARQPGPGRSRPPPGGGAMTDQAMTDHEELERRVAGVLHQQRRSP